MAFGHKEIKRAKGYDNKSETLPQKCEICNNSIFTSDSYCFTPTDEKRIYYHSKCFTPLDKMVKENGLTHEEIINGNA